MFCPGPAGSECSFWHCWSWHSSWQAQRLGRCLSNGPPVEIDYCCSLYTCLNQSSLHRLQLVQNAAARLLSRSKKSCHMTPILADLHWLLVSFTIHCRLLLNTYKALNGLAPSYIGDLLHDYTTSRSLRSCEQGLLAVSPTQLSTKGVSPSLSLRSWERPRLLRASEDSLRHTCSGKLLFSRPIWYLTTNLFFPILLGVVIPV